MELQHLKDTEVIRLAETHPESLQILGREMARRGLLSQGLDSTGLYDASEDQYDTPTHEDEVWIVRGRE